MSQVTRSESWLHTCSGWIHLSNERCLTGRSALQQLILIIQRLAGEVHLRHESFVPARHIKVNMRWPSPVVDPCRVRAGLNRLEAELPLRIADLNAVYLKIRIERRRVGIVDVGIPSVDIRLPDFQLDARQRLALRVHHAPHQVDDLPFGARPPPTQVREISIALKRLRDGRKRAEHVILGPRLLSLSKQSIEFATRNESAQRRRHL